MKLRRNEYCPIHRSVRCCGRERTHYARSLQPGVRRIEDPHHPRGYRELRSPAEMRKLLNRKIVEQGRKCAICHENFTDYNDPYLTTGNRKEWAAGGETIIPTISKQRISGAMKRKARAEWSIEPCTCALSLASSVSIDQGHRSIVAPRNELRASRRALKAPASIQSTTPPRIKVDAMSPTARLVVIPKPPRAETWNNPAMSGSHPMTGSRSGAKVRRHAQLRRRVMLARPGAYFKSLSTRRSSASGSTSGMPGGCSVSSQGQRRRPAPSGLT